MCALLGQSNRDAVDVLGLVDAFSPFPKQLWLGQRLSYHCVYRHPQLL